MAIDDTGIIFTEDIQAQNKTVIIHVISDSTGSTAINVVQGATVQFPRGAIQISCLSHVENSKQVRAYLDRYVADGSDTAIFHTILSDELRRDVRYEAENRGIASVDVLGPALSIVSQLLGQEPLNVPGLLVNRDSRLVRQIDARLL